MDPLTSWGFGPRFLSQLREAETPGRVIFASRGHLRVATADAVRDALVDLPLRTRDDPIVVGDWVVLREGSPPVATRRLERTGVLRRRDPGGGVQVVAANVDLLLVCTGADAPNLRRIERWQALAADGGAELVVALTKADLPGADGALVAVRTVEPRAVAVSAVTGAGLTDLRALLAPGTTAALLGVSGAGKSTLLNALAGEALRATAAVREADGRGRHTTTDRVLFRLPWGGLLLDNPGVRQVGVLDAVDGVFPEIEALLGACRYRDCAHDAEPGCAIREALDSGAVSEARFDAWRKLAREVAYEARREDPAKARAERDRWKRIHKGARARRRLEGD